MTAEEYAQLKASAVSRDDYESLHGWMKGAEAPAHMWRGEHAHGIPISSLAASGMPRLCMTSCMPC